MQNGPRRLSCIALLCIATLGAPSDWRVLNDTSTDGGVCFPPSPAVVCDTWQCCADFCERYLPKCAAVAWGNGGGCNFKCASNHTTRAQPGTLLAIVRPDQDLCNVPDAPTPPHLTPTIHFAPPPVYYGGGWHDIAGAITHNGVHHIYQGTGWNHANSTDLVHWQTAARGPVNIEETYAGMESRDDPCSGFITKDPDDGNRVCAGFRQCSSKRGVAGMPHAWDVPLELRCALDDELTAWANVTADIDYLFNVSFWRPVPYDPARPWRDADGQWSVLLSLDACNASGLPPGGRCLEGGQLGMWRSPALRGAEADWRYAGPVFTSNKTVLDSGHLSREFVTIDLIGMLEGDPHPGSGSGSGTRIFLNNVGGNGGGDGCCHGTTSYFPVVQPAPGTPFEQVAPQGMVDWGAFSFADNKTAGQILPPNATGVQLLYSGGQTSRGLSMARTLGSEEADQVTKPGRRVLVGWTGPADWRVHVVTNQAASMQSLPRDLSLASDRSLLQRFVPELQVLRQRRVAGASVAVAGLQAEVLATFPAGCAATDRPARACTLRFGDYGELVLDYQQQLLLLDLTAGNNSAVRAGPMPPPAAGSGGWQAHVYIDHQIIELIVNNATAMVAYWSPPASVNASLQLAVAGGGTIEAWELKSAHNNSRGSSVPVLE
eukprot:g7435.t1